MYDLIGLVGVLLCFAGAHMLWMARHEILYWMDTYLLLFRRSFDAAQRGHPDSAGISSDDARTAHGLQERPRERSEMWLMLGGFALVGVGLAATGLVLANFVLRRLL